MPRRSAPIFGRDPDKDKLTEELFRDSVHLKIGASSRIVSGQKRNMDLSWTNRIVLPMDSISTSIVCSPSVW